MLKAIVLPGRLILATTLTFLFASCTMNAIKGSGNVTTENRPITGDFQSIEASNGLDVVVEQAEKASITVEADDNLQESIITKIDNGVLTIKCKYNTYTNATKKVTVQMPNVDEIEASSGVNLSSKNTFHGKSITLSTSSGADMKVAIEAERAECEASSGSHITVTGKAIKLLTSTSSGSDINAENLLSNEVRASASSGSTVDVHPIVSLDAEASSGGNVSYHNIPKTMKRNTSSGGSISNH